MWPSAIKSVTRRFGAKGENYVMFRVWAIATQIYFKRGGHTWSGTQIETTNTVGHFSLPNIIDNILVPLNLLLPICLQILRGYSFEHRYQRITPQKEHSISLSGSYNPDMPL